MKVIIAGCRHFGATIYYDVVKQAISDSGFPIDEVVCGCAKGVDQWGSKFAIDNDIPVTNFVPDWEAFGKAAGPRRNTEMAEYGDALIAVWDGKSRGTADMIRKARVEGLEVFIVNV